MKKRIIIGVGFFLLGIICLLIWYFLNLSIIGKNEPVMFEISPKTSTSTIISNLKDKGLIHSELVTKIYVYLSKKDNLQAGTYELNKNMNTYTIIDKLNHGDVYDNSISITFKEGKRLSNLASQIHTAFNYDYDDIMSQLSDQNFLNDLINKYWFLSSDILNNKIYYPLEGYLYPDTYVFNSDATIKEIVTKMLDNTNNKLEPYKEEINQNSLSYHKILTIASIVELEASNATDRQGVSGVIYNRLNNGWTLGSDVTAYYGAKKEMTDIITQSDLNDCNPYNTRSTCVGSLPVGPICSPSIESIIAALEPAKSDYYFFVADINSKVYFSKTVAEQDNVIATLKSQNLWYNY